MGTGHAHLHILLGTQRVDWACTPVYIIPIRYQVPHISQKIDAVNAHGCCTDETMEDESV